MLPNTPPLNRRLASLLEELQRSPRTRWCRAASRRPPTRVEALQPTLDYLAPAQIQCNYVTLLFRNISSLLSEGDRNGTWQRFIIVTTPQGPNGEGGPSSAPANGPTKDNHVHINPYPNTARRASRRSARRATSRT